VDGFFFKAKGFTRGTLGDRVLSLRLLKSLWIETVSIRVVQRYRCQIEQIGFSSLRYWSQSLYPYVRKWVLPSLCGWMLVGPRQGIMHVKSMLFNLYKMKNMGRASLYLRVGLTRLPGGAIKLSNPLCWENPRTFWIDELQWGQIANGEGPSRIEWGSPIARRNEGISIDSRCFKSGFGHHQTGHFIHGI